MLAPILSAMVCDYVTIFKQTYFNNHFYEIGICLLRFIRRKFISTVQGVTPADLRGLETGVFGIQSSHTVFIHAILRREGRAEKKNIKASLELCAKHVNHIISKMHDLDDTVTTLFLTTDAFGDIDRDNLMPLYISNGRINGHIFETNDWPSNMKNVIQNWDFRRFGKLDNATVGDLIVGLIYDGKKSPSATNCGMFLFHQVINLFVKLVDKLGKRSSFSLNFETFFNKSNKDLHILKATYPQQFKYYLTKQLQNDDGKNRDFPGFFRHRLNQKYTMEIEKDG